MFKQTLVFSFLAFFVGPISYGQTADQPIDQFLKAYFLIEEGESAERHTETTKAVEKFSAASEILGKIRKALPDWQPALVESRIQYCTDHINHNSGEVVKELKQGGETSADPRLQAILVANEAYREKLSRAEEDIKRASGITDERFQALLKENRDTKDRLVQLMAGLVENEAQLSILQKDKRTLAEENQRMKESLGTGALNDRSQQLLKENREYQEKLAKAENNYFTIQAQLQKMEKEKGDVEAIQKENKRLKELVDRSENESKKGNAEDTGSLKMELANTRQQLDDLRKEYQKRQDISKELESRVKKLDAELVKAINSGDQRVEVLTKSNQTLKELLDQAQQIAKEHQSSPREVALLKEQLADTRKEAESLKAENKSRTSECRELQARADKLSDELNRTDAYNNDDRLERLRKENEEYKKQLAKVQDQLTDQQRRSPDEDRLEVLLKENTALKEKLAKLDDLRDVRSNSEEVALLKTELAETRNQLLALQKESSSRSESSIDEPRVKVLDGSGNDEQFHALLRENKELKEKLNQFDEDLKSGTPTAAQLTALKSELIRNQNDLERLKKENVARTEERNSFLARLKDLDLKFKTTSTENRNKILSLLKENDDYRQKLLKAEDRLIKIQSSSSSSSHEISDSQGSKEN